MAVQFPAVAMVGVIVGFVAVIALLLQAARCAKFLGPIYAIAEGFFVGAISKVFETQWNGIVLQAAGATLAVFAVMLRALQHAHHQGHRPLPARPSSSPRSA